MRPGSRPAPRLTRIVLGEQDIAGAVGRLGNEITRDYRDRNPVVVGVLNGAFFFTCDLIRRIETPVALDFLSLRRFRPENSGNRQVEIIRDLTESIEDREVLIVEDLVDTGLSLNYLCQALQDRKPRSVAICSLLDRPQLRLVDLPLKYVGFEVDDQFLVGYGLDFQGCFRGLPYIGALEPAPGASQVA